MKWMWQHRVFLHRTADCTNNTKNRVSAKLTHMRAHTHKSILFLFVDGGSLGRSVKCVSGVGFLHQVDLKVTLRAPATVSARMHAPLLYTHLFSRSLITRTSPFHPSKWSSCFICKAQLQFSASNPWKSCSVSSRNAWISRLKKKEINKWGPILLVLFWFGINLI